MGCLAYDVENSAGNKRLRHPGRQNSSRFHPGNRAEVFMWQNFQPAYWDPGWKNRDLGNRASPPSHTNNTSKILQRIYRSGEISETGFMWRDLEKPQKVDSAIQWIYLCPLCIMQLMSQVLIRWTMIYPVDRTIQGLNNRCLASYRFTCPVSSNSL